jgi:hypothetical protein
MAAERHASDSCARDCEAQKLSSSYGHWRISFTPLLLEIHCSTVVRTEKGPE